MIKHSRQTPDRFQPTRTEEVFALYLARELQDSARVRWYAALTHRYSMCLLLLALRRTRARARVQKAQVSPEAFMAALADLMLEGTAQ